MLTLALRTLPLLVQPRPSKVWRSFQLFSPARTCLPTLLPRQTLVDAPTRLVQLRLLPGMVVRPFHRVLKDQRGSTNRLHGGGAEGAARDASFCLSSFLLSLKCGFSSCYKCGSGTCDTSHFALTQP